MHIDSAVSYRQGLDSEYGNTFALFTPSPQQAASGFDVTVHFNAIRREHMVSLSAAALKSTSTTDPGDPKLQRYLEPDKLVPLSGVIADLAKEHTAGDTTKSRKPAISTITSSPPCAMTNPAKAGAAATPCGPAPRSAATAPIFIPCSSA